MSKHIQIILTVLFGIGAGGCAVPAVAKDSLSNDIAGQKLYVAKCAKCHKFYDPAKYSEADWQMWMSKMTKKARLKPEQEEVLSRYIAENLRSPKGATKTLPVGK